MEQRPIGFLIHDVSRLYRRRFDEATRELGVTGPQLRALLTMMRVPGINQGTLAETLDVEPITTCRMVDRLEQAGLVERRRDPRDRRAWQLFLTEKAHPVVHSARALGEIVHSDSTLGLTPDAIVGLRAALEIIQCNLANTIPAPEEKQAVGDEASQNQKAMDHG